MMRSIPLKYIINLVYLNLNKAKYVYVYVMHIETLINPIHKRVLDVTQQELV